MFGLRARPHVKHSFAFQFRLGRIDNAIGVFGGVEAAVFVGHVAQHVVEDAPGDASKECIVRDLIRLEVRDGELRLVVEHLFEMWHKPALVH